MRVRQPFVPMRMRVRLDERHVARVLVGVMLVVHVEMVVLEGLVGVLVLVPFTREKHHARRHERGRDGLQPFAEKRHGCERTGERRDREERRLPCRPEEPHGVDGQRDARAVAHGAERERRGQA